MRKTLGDFECPQIDSLLHLVESQSKQTLCRWSIAYAQANMLPVFELSFPDDFRPRNALINAQGWLEGRVKFVDAKETNNGAHNAATEAEGHPAAQTAARAIAHASLTIHVSAHCLGIAFYGAAALAYAKLGLAATQEEYLHFAEQAWFGMEQALRQISVANEPTPAKIGTHFWSSRLR